MCSGEVCDNAILNIAQQPVVPRRISRVWSDQRIGQSVITSLIIVLVKSNDQKTVVGLCPLVIAVEVLLEPGVASRNALSRFAVVHVVIQVRNDERDRRQRSVVAGKIYKSQIGRGFDRRSVGNVREADPRYMLSGVNALVPAAVWRVEIDRRADAGQAFGISLEREALGDQLLAEAAGLERVIGVVGLARHLIAKTDVLIAA